MRRLLTYLSEVGHWMALLLLLSLAGLIIAALAGSKALERVVDALAKQLVAGVLVALIVLIMALYFGVQVIRARRERGLITHAGTRGEIRIAPGAVREFIARVLEEELDLTDCRVHLKTGSGEDAPLMIRVRVSLPLGQNMVEAGERIQELLARRVGERIGLPVERVEVITASIRRSGPAFGQGTPSQRSYITSFSEGDFEEEFRG